MAFLKRFRLPARTPQTWALIAFLTLCFSISPDSIDMDEAQTWDYARLGTFSQVVDELRSDRNSESQMPLGMIAWWAWCQVFGTSEIAMRSINLLWAALALIALASIGRQIGRPWLPMLFAVQPFVWYCMDHARTPVMQMAGGAILFCGSISALREPQLSVGNLVLLCGGAILLCGASMLGVIPVLALVIGITLHGFWKRLPATRAAKVTVLATGLMLTCLALYYATTLARGAGGAKIWAVSPLNVAFVAYEFLGLQGLGPGRQTIRAIVKGFEGAGPLLFAIPGICLMLACYIGIAACAFKSWLTREFSTLRPALAHVRVWFMAVGVLLGSIVLLFVLASLVSFPFWGRHLAGVFPFWVTAVAITIHWSHQGLWRRAGRGFGIALIGLLICGCLLIRLSPYHSKDNYRFAALEASRLANANKIVWWVADRSGGEYYGLNFDPTAEGENQIVLALNLSAAGPLPDAIAVSRPDNFDSLSTVTRILKSGSFRKTSNAVAFEIWERL